MTCPSARWMSSRQRSLCTVNAGAATLRSARGKGHPQRCSVTKATHAVLCVLQAGEDCGDSREES